MQISVSITAISPTRHHGRPHVTLLLGVWLQGALYFCTGPAERKAKNLARNPLCGVTTGRNSLEGLDLRGRGCGRRGERR